MLSTLAMMLTNFYSIQPMKVLLILSARKCKNICLLWLRVSIELHMSIRKLEILGYIKLISLYEMGVLQV